MKTINLYRNVFILAVTAALDKTDNEHIAKELTRIIYTLTSKESNQGRGWCSLICNCDGLRILIKMLDATVEFVVTLSGNFLRNFKGSPDPSHFIFEIDVGKKRIRHRTTLNLDYNRF